jgi:HSP20 family protein
LNGGAVRRYRTERWQGRFVRSFVVPRGLDGQQVKADYHDGVLTVRLPKPAAAPPQRIAIGREGSAVESADEPAVINAPTS